MIIGYIIIDPPLSHWMIYQMFARIIRLWILHIAMMPIIIIMVLWHRDDFYCYLDIVIHRVCQALFSICP